MSTRWIALLMAGLVTAGCAQPDIVSRDAPFTEPGQSTMSARAATFEVAEIAVVVPEELSVSEANSFFPDADIVWRGDPLGDRHEQVHGILSDALMLAGEGLSGPERIRVEIKLERFHALTQKARYTTGGLHNIRFVLQLRDLATGDLIGEPTRVNASLIAYGGQRAIEADARGETQRVRITRHVADVVRAHLGAPPLGLPLPEGHAIADARPAPAPAPDTGAPG
ncbi:MAG: hypothetical protein JJU40_12765 [Rhodobacteraceae bacterium]|nr:hypothetical protein [Paracoccaceae bacterium]